MIFNVVRPADKARAQKIILRRMLIIERGFRKALRIELNKIVKEAADSLEQGVTVFDTVVNNHRFAFFYIFRTAYKRAGHLFSEQVFNSVQGLKGIHTPEIKGMKEEFWNAFFSFVELNTASRVMRVSSFTKRWIADKVLKGTTDGKSPAKIAKDLRETGKFNKARASRIARTEVHMVSNFATQEAVKSTRLDTEKEWVAFIDDRTRDSHILMNGVKVPMEQDFLVGTSLMQYPGDPRGGAKNVINCRCVVLYSTARKNY